MEMDTRRERNMKFTWGELAAQAIGEAVMDYLEENMTYERLFQEAEHRALKALEDIREALDDEFLDDPECFSRIEAIINALENHGIYTSRHDF